MKKIIATTIAAAAITIGATACAPLDDTVALESASKVVNAIPGVTNAEKAAEQYLNYSPFSRSGLIKQLVFEGYSQEDAEAATDAQNADWNAQAVRMANLYLETGAFSESALMDQLEYEGFTTEQATYGVGRAYR